MTIRRFASLLILIPVLLGIVIPASTIQAQSDSTEPLVILLTADGPLTPVMSNYLARGIVQAEAENAAAIVLRLNTPGGSVDLMTDMVQDILNSSVPVIVYVSPLGSMAGSAGTLITFAGHLAFMAPGTTLGAAAPVDSQGQDIETTLEEKVVNILSATARTLTIRRGADAVEAAEATIREARAVTEDEALEINLIDGIAADLDDLLAQVDGMTVQVNGEPMTLELTGAAVEEVPYNIVEQALQLLTDPNIVFLLLALGVQAILIEISSPGGWVAGFIGVLCVLLAVYGLNILPVNWFGLLLIVVSFVLFILDIKAPTHGALTAAGTGAFIAGALVLFNSVHMPGFPNVSIILVVGVGIFLAATFSVVVSIALKAQRTPIRMGRESLVGKQGFARSVINPNGYVQVAGEQWTALVEEGAESIPVNSPVEVVKVEGLKLIVKKI
ncbi:MAG TPA: nodulation protein NfeD [Longilinea sp.]|nr:nodulation protein NfeD [Longilinea sp.]